MDPKPTWSEWFIISIPVVFICDLILWGVLLGYYKIYQGEIVDSNEEEQLLITDIGESVHLERSHLFTRQDQDWSSTQIIILLVTLFTIFLWIIESFIENFVGDMGIISIIPMVVFFGTGILTKQDFNNFLWTVVVLAEGGIGLGKAVESSGLLSTMVKGIEIYLNDKGMIVACLIITLVILVATTFISHTVGALIMLPIVTKIGQGMKKARTLVMTSTLTCSVAMGLSVSSFPNMNAVALEDQVGNPVLEVGDLMVVGVGMSVVCWFVVVTVGYGICLVIGFD